MAPGAPFLYEQPLPLLTYSFSSKGFPDLVDQFRTYLSLIPSAYLVSLYDYKYQLGVDNLLPVADDRIRIWDSGGYETREYDDISAVKPGLPGTPPWDEELYVEVANAIPWNGKDILVSYDGRDEQLSISAQLARAMTLFERIRGSYLTDVLLHLKYPPDANEIAKALVSYADKVNVLGFTEKEIAPNWVEGVLFLHKLRAELSRLEIGNNLLIHIFGCFDPKTIIRFALSGADIFDGLTWLRYLFYQNSTLYKREFEYLVSPSDLLQAPVESSVVAHNIRELETLRSNVAYALITSDLTAFEAEYRILADVTLTV